MGTFSKAYIKVDNIEIVKEIIGLHYRIISEEFEDNEQDWKFFQNESDTIVLSMNYHKDWVEMIFNHQYSLYFHDELFRRISKKLETEILLGYYQSTVVEGRLAKFKNGDLQISIIQKETIRRGGIKMTLVDNWGVTEELKKEFLIPKLNEEYFEIEWDVIYKFYNMNGFIPNSDLTVEKEVYHHLEIKYD